MNLDKQAPLTDALTTVESITVRDKEHFESYIAWVTHDAHLLPFRFVITEPTVIVTPIFYIFIIYEARIKATEALCPDDVIILLI